MLNMASTHRILDDKIKKNYFLTFIYKSQKKTRDFEFISFL